MSYINQYVGISDSGISDGGFGDIGQTQTIVGLVVASSSGSGTGYLIGDVGATITLTGGTFTTAATGVITSVSNGRVTGVSLTNGGVYSIIPGSDRNNGTSAVTGGTGTGLQVGVCGGTIPMIQQTGQAGFPSTITQFTVSTWLHVDCYKLTISNNYPTSFFSSYGYGRGINVSMDTGAFNAYIYDGAISGYIFRGSWQLPNGVLLMHIAFSWNETTQSVQLYVNDQPITATFVAWDNPATPIPNPTSAIWLINGDTQANDSGSNDYGAAAVASIWMGTSFIDLSVVGNRRTFINADLTPVDPSTLPSAPINMYLNQGDTANAFAANHSGTSGAWSVVGGPLDFAKAHCYTFLTSSDHSVNAAYMTPVTASVQGSYTPGTPGVTNDVVVADVTIRPNGTTTFALVTNPTHGSVVMASDGTYTYTPTTWFSNTVPDTFTYTATEQMPAGYTAPGYSNTQTVSVWVSGPPLSLWSTTSDATSPSAGGIGDQWMDQQYVDFSNLTTRRKFINADKSWISLGYLGDIPTGTYPLVWNHVQTNNTSDDFTYGYGQGGRAQGWNTVANGVDPTTGLAYPAMSFDVCTVVTGYFGSFFFG